MGPGSKGTGFGKMGRVVALLLAVCLLAACGSDGISMSSSAQQSTAVREPVSLSSLESSAESEVGQESDIEFEEIVWTFAQWEDVAGCRWVDNTAVNFHAMQPVVEEGHENVGLEAFVCVEINGVWGFMTFDGELIFEPQMQEPVYYSTVPYVSGFPQEFYDSAEGERSLLMQGIDFPDIPISPGGTGITQYVFFQHPETLELFLCEQESGPPHVVAADMPITGEIPPAMPYYMAKQGVSQDLSDLFEYYQYSQFGIALADKTILTQRQFDNTFYSFKNGFMAVGADDMWGYFSVSDGRQITPLIYDQIWYTEMNWTWPGLGFFNEGYCPVAKDGKYGFIDKDGNEAVPLVFEGATHVYQGKAWVKQNGLWGQIEITA